MPHVRHVSRFVNQPSKKAPRPPHHAHRRRTPRHNIFGSEGRDTFAPYGPDPRDSHECVEGSRRCSSSSRRSASPWPPAGGGCSASPSTRTRAPTSPPSSSRTRRSAARSQRSRPTHTAATLGVPVADVQAQVDQLAQTTAGAELMRQIVADAHGTLIGARPGPVQITGAQLVELTRDQRVGNLPPVVLPVERDRRAVGDPDLARVGGSDRRHRRCRLPAARPARPPAQVRRRVRHRHLLHHRRHRRRS